MLRFLLIISLLVISILPTQTLIADTLFSDNFDAHPDWTSAFGKPQPGLLQQVIPTAMKPSKFCQPMQTNPAVSRVSRPYSGENHIQAVVDISMTRF